MHKFLRFFETKYDLIDFKVYMHDIFIVVIILRISTLCRLQLAKSMPNVNPEILKWARETAGLSLGEAADALGLSETKKWGTPYMKLQAIELGSEEPSRHLLVEMAKKYRRPLVTFYMSAPPRKGNRGKDFRTLPVNEDARETYLLDALLRNVQARQSIIRAALEDEEESEALPFVSSAKITDGHEAVSASIQKALGFDIGEFQQQPTPGDAFALLRAKAEAVGIFVLLIGDLGSHHTKIDTQSFRGYALADPIAPFVIINDNDSHSAWSFTLFHELAHIWLGETGISGEDFGDTVERFCNSVAGYSLLPLHQLDDLRVDQQTPFPALTKRIEDFAKDRNVSCSMIAYNLLRKGTIDEPTWAKLNKTFRNYWLEGRDKQKAAQKEKSNSGPTYYVLRRHRLGAGLIETVQYLLNRGALSTSRAGKVLNVKSTNLPNLFETNSSW